MKIDAEKNDGGSCAVLGHEQVVGQNDRHGEFSWGEIIGYLTTREAARYVRRSVSWLLRQPDIAYIPGKPNLYEQKDLDAWLQKHKVRPRVKV